MMPALTPVERPTLPKVPIGASANWFVSNHRCGCRLSTRQLALTPVELGPSSSRPVLAMSRPARNEKGLPAWSVRIELNLPPPRIASLMPPPFRKAAFAEWQFHIAEPTTRCAVEGRQAALAGAARVVLRKRFRRLELVRFRSAYRSLVTRCSWPGRIRPLENRRWNLNDKAL